MIPVSNKAFDPCQRTPASTQHPARMLVVDDEPGVMRLVKRVAEGCGYSVTCTSSAAQFLDALVETNPAFIVMDLSMPETDGVELLRFLAATKCNALILIISGFDARVLETTGRLAAAMGLQVAGTLTKPVRLAELRKAISGTAASGLA